MISRSYGNLTHSHRRPSPGQKSYPFLPSTLTPLSLAPSNTQTLFSASHGHASCAPREVALQDASTARSYKESTRFPHSEVQPRA